MEKEQELFDNLCVSQMEKTAEIRKVLDLHKKLPKNKRNTTSIKTEIEKLDILWTDYKTADDIIKAHNGYSEEHNYIQKECYQKTENWYNLIFKNLNEDLKCLTDKEDIYYIPAPKEPVQQTSHISTEQKQGTSKDFENQLEPHSLLDNLTPNLNNVSFSISDARFLIPTFNGNTRELHKFISSCDDIFATASSPAEEDSLFSLIKSKLSADAYDVYRYNPVSDWPALKIILNQTFETKVPRAILQSQLNNCRQNLGESVKDFLQRLHIIFSKLNEATYLYTCDNLLLNSLLKDNENQAVRTMEDGLLDAQLQTLAKVHVDKRFLSLKNHILEHASRIETIHLNTQSGSKTTQNPIIRCYNCNKLGHSSNRCSQIKKFNQQGHSQFPSNSQISGRSNNVYKENLNSNLRCFKCNKLGHIAPKCTSNQTFYYSAPRTANSPFQKPPTSLQTQECRYCHRLGHSLEECRTRTMNNARFQNVEKDLPRNRFQEQNNRVNIATQNLTSSSKFNGNNSSSLPGNSIQRGVNLGNPSLIQTVAEIHQNQE